MLPRHIGKLKYVESAALIGRGECIGFCDWRAEIVCKFCGFWISTDDLLMVRLYRVELDSRR